jgi:hypothetical protein
LYKRVLNTRVEIGNGGSCRSNTDIVIRSRKKGIKKLWRPKKIIKGSSTVNKQTQKQQQKMYCFGNRRERSI